MSSGGTESCAVKCTLKCTKTLKYVQKLHLDESLIIKTDTGHVQVVDTTIEPQSKKCCVKINHKILLTRLGENDSETVEIWNFPKPPGACFGLLF